MVLRKDGTALAGGHDRFGQNTVPFGFNNVIAIGPRGAYVVSFKKDGTVAVCVKMKLHP